MQRPELLNVGKERKEGGNKPRGRDFSLGSFSNLTSMSVCGSLFDVFEGEVKSLMHIDNRRGRTGKVSLLCPCKITGRLCRLDF